MAITPTEHTSDGRLGRLTPATYELILSLALINQTSAQSDVAYAKRTFGEHHQAVGVARDKLRVIDAAVVEILNYGQPTPATSVAA